MGKNQNFRKKKNFRELAISAKRTKPPFSQYFNHFLNILLKALLKAIGNDSEIIRRPHYYFYNLSYIVSEFLTQKSEKLAWDPGLYARKLVVAMGLMSKN